MSSVSGYIHERNPQKYGGNQKDYIDRSKIIVNLGARKISLAREQKSSLTALFFDLLNFFGDQRQALAKRHNTRNAAYFGKRRTSPDEFLATHTGLVPLEYLPYNMRISQLLKKSIQKMGLPSVTQTTLSFPTSQMHLEVLDEEALKKQGLLEKDGKVKVPSDTVKKIYGPLNFKIPFDQCNLTQKSQYNSQLSHLRDTDPAFYTQFVTCQELMNFEEECQIYAREVFFLRLLPKYSKVCELASSTATSFVNSRFIRATISEKIGTATFTIFKYLVLTPAVTTKPLDFGVILFHMDKFDTDSSLKNIATLFEKIILSDPNSKEFLPLMGRFRRAMSVTMPFVRGSAAIEEWFEKSLFQVKGFEIAYHDTFNVNLEAYAQPDASLFLHDYANQTFFTLQKTS